MDPVLFPNLSPYATFNNSPVLLDDPEGDCSTCPTKGNYEGRHYKAENGDYYYSNNYWVPGDKYQEWKDKSDKGTFSDNYFAYYAGYFGHDPVREDWDRDTYKNRIEKNVRVRTFMNLYNNDVADNLMWHYAYGNGEDYNIPLDDFKKGVGIRQRLGLQNFKGGKKAIDEVLKSGSWTNVHLKQKVYAVNAGTLGNYTLILDGKLKSISKNSWMFEGTLQISDTYNFNVANRNSSDEADVAFARERLWGTPFKVTGKYNVSQFSMTSPVLSIYTGMSKENIISNKAKLEQIKRDLRNNLGF